MNNDVFSYEEYSESSQFWENMDKQIVLWRKNVHRFISEYFGVRLAEFQKIILYEMARDTNNIRQLIFWASRGVGKSFLTLLFALAMGVLYPGIKIVVSSPTIGQAKEMLDKFNELQQQYPNIANEVEDYNTAKDGAIIKLYGGSQIRTVVCNNNARGIRCQILILDEFIGMDKSIVDDVLSKFLTVPRYPMYRSQNKYKDYKNNETNRKIYLSSINTTTEWGYEEFLSFNKMIERGDNNYFTISVPYQFGVKGGMIQKGYIKSEVNKLDTDVNKFRSEMECIPLGETDSALFRYESLNRQRTLNDPLYPMTDEEYFEARQSVGNGEFGTADELQKLVIKRNKYYQPKIEGEIRAMSCDIANMSGAKNDDSAYIVYRLFPVRISRINSDTGEEETQMKYIKHVSYIESHNGMRIDAQALRIKQLFYDLECDYVIIDMQGVGNSVYEECAKRTYDQQRNKFYPAWCPLNATEDMLGKVMDENPERVIYALKTAGNGVGRVLQEMVTLVTVNLDRGDLHFLKTIVDSYDYLDARYNYRFLKGNAELKFNEEAKRISKPFEYTSTLIQQAITVKKIDKGYKGIEIKEAKTTDKKDIVMSLIYGIYLISMLERDLVFEDRTSDFTNMAIAATEPTNRGIQNASNNRFGGFGGFGSFGGFGTGGYRSFFN